MNRYFIPVLAALLGGCASSPAVLKSARVPVIENRELPQPSTGELVPSLQSYLVGPLDKISIQVFGADALNQDQIQVDANGQIQVPLAGQLDAAGKTPGQLSRDIEARLRPYIKNPQVAVNLLETNSQVITVDGQVGKPGLYPVLGKMTLMRAVATAGGVSEFAKLNDVVIFRTVNGQRYAGLYNLAAIRSGTYDDPEVYSNDVVVVGDSKARRLFKNVLQMVPALTSPLIILLRG
jgi:polysaccharide export outer membrane protein